MEKVIVNGKALAYLPVSDRGLHYGDGLFDTLLIKGGEAQYWHRHQQRLIIGCYRLKLPIPDLVQLEEEVSTLSFDQDRAIIKIIITRGNGERGYQLPETAHSNRIVARYAWPGYPDENWSKGVRIRMCATTLGLNPALAGLKHCNRLEQVLARAEWRSPEIAEGLMMDINDSVIEGTMSNLFIVKNAKIKTPALDNCGVEGVMRGVLLDTAKDQIIPVAVDKVTIEDVVDADELFLTNSLIGIWPVRQFEDKKYAVGPITKQLNKNLVDK